MKRLKELYLYIAAITIAILLILGAYNAIRDIPYFFAGGITDTIEIKSIRRENTLRREIDRFAIIDENGFDYICFGHLDYISEYEIRNSKNTSLNTYQITYLPNSRIVLSIRGTNGTIYHLGSKIVLIILLLSLFGFGYILFQAIENEWFFKVVRKD